MEIQGRALHSIEAGEPLVTSAFTHQTVTAPSDWWTLAIALGQDFEPGTQVRLVLRLEPETLIIDGVAVESEA